MGYAKRVAEENGLTEYLAASIDIQGESPQRVSARTRDEPKVGRNRKCAFKDINVNDFSAVTWNVRYSRFCPLCLRQHGIWKVEWECMFYDVCHLHQCWLVGTCSVCGNEITWKRGHLLQCDCGSRFSSERPVVAPDSVAGLAVAMASRFVGGMADDKITLLEQCNLAQIQRITLLLGSYADNPAGSRPQKIPNLGSLCVSWRLTSLAAEILVDWPRSFFSLLKQMDGTTTPTKQPLTLGKQFGHLYFAAYRVLKDPCFDFLRDGFQEFLINHWRGPIANRNKRLHENFRSKGGWIASNVACKELGISPKRLRHMIDDGTIVGHVFLHAQSGRICALVNRDDIAEARNTVDEHLDLRSAGIALRLGKKRMMNIRSRLFPGARRATSAANSPWIIPRKDIECILKVGAGLKICSEIDGARVSFGDVIRYWMWSDECIAELILQIVDGSRLPIAKLEGGKGINSWIFLKQDLHEWHRAWSSAGCETFSVSELAAYLGVKQEVAYFLVRKGFIQSSTESKLGVTGRRVSKIAIEEFQQSYLLLAKIARNLNSSTRGLLTKLASLQIHPISGPGIDGGRQVVMRRTPQLELVLSALLPNGGS